ncbi:hypothetical protein [Marinobacter salarius]|uniref:hypothetical protein n=1 Tax=Marinobacter salarius TaxID=1420917 RepID=UPI003BAB9D73
MTLEEQLKTKKIVRSPVTEQEVSVPLSFIVDVQEEREDGVHFIIHPLGHSGDTLDFVVNGNDLKAL